MSPQSHKTLRMSVETKQGVLFNFSHYADMVRVQVWVKATKISLHNDNETAILNTGRCRYFKILQKVA